MPDVAVSPQLRLDGNVFTVFDAPTWARGWTRGWRNKRGGAFGKHQPAGRIGDELVILRRQAYGTQRCGVLERACRRDKAGITLFGFDHNGALMAAGSFAGVKNPSFMVKTSAAVVSRRQRN